MSNQDKETIVLLPCPVCGANPNKQRESLDERYAYADRVTYKCSTCGLSAGSIGDTSKGGYANNSKAEDLAIKNWNTKANSPVVAKSTARISELEAEVDRLKECLTTIYPYVKDKHVWGRKKRPDGSILNIYIGKEIEEAMKGGE